MVVVVDVQLNRYSKVYHENELVRGVAIIQCKNELKHDGIVLLMEGQVNLQLSSKTVGIFEAFYQSVKPIQMLSYQIELAKAGKLSPGRTELPFEFPLRARHNRTLYETYHGVFINIQYSLKCEVKRSFLIGTSMAKTTEFIVEYGSSAGVPATAPTSLSPAQNEFTVPAEMKRVDFEIVSEAGSKLGFFKAHGHLDSVNCPITKPFTGEIIIDKSEFPIKSIEVQLVRVETCGASEGFSLDASEIQTIQIGEGNVCKGLPIPIYMVFPRLFSCPTVLSTNFKIGTLEMAEEDTKNMLLPTKPTEPLDSDCCGTGCTLCVFDIYKTQVQKWEKQCEDIISGNALPDRDYEVLDTLFIVTQFEFKPFKLVNIIADTKDSKIYSFNCTSVTDSENKVIINAGKSFPVKIGQHVVLKIGDLSRQYTVLRVNDDTFDILIKIYSNGKLTPLIDKTALGDLIEFRGPFGTELPLKPNIYSNILILAAGTGIAPMFRVIETILNNEEDETRIKLLFSCKRIEEVLLKGYLKTWSSYWNFQVHYFLSYKDESIPYGWKVEFKRICYQTVENVIKSKPFLDKTNLFLICGTKSFEKDILNYLHRLGVSDEFIRVF